MKLCEYCRNPMQDDGAHEVMWDDERCLNIRMAKENTTLICQVRVLREALEDALEGMEDMVSYVSDYFRQKWGHDEYVARARAALAASKQETSDAALATETKEGAVTWIVREGKERGKGLYLQLHMPEWGERGSAIEYSMRAFAHEAAILSGGRVVRLRRARRHDAERMRALEAVAEAARITVAQYSPLWMVAPQCIALHDAICKLDALESGKAARCQDCGEVKELGYLMGAGRCYDCFRKVAEGKAK